MPFYRDRIFPRLMDVVMRQRPFTEERAHTLAPAAGDVLEIGFGTGLNLPHYPAAVQQLTLIDPARLLPERVAERLAQSGRQAEIVHADAAAMPFDRGRFDCVVSTFTLCTIPDVARALREMHRVLKPTGQLLFVEHGRSDARHVALLQDCINPFQRLIGAGCNLNRPIDRLILDAGFQLQTLDRYIQPGSLRALGEHYRGIARHA